MKMTPLEIDNLNFENSWLNYIYLIIFLILKKIEWLLNLKKFNS
jgi:hypothetical protein